MSPNDLFAARLATAYNLALLCALVLVTSLDRHALGGLPFETSSVVWFFWLLDTPYLTARVIWVSTGRSRWLTIANIGLLVAWLAVVTLPLTLLIPGLGGLIEWVLRT